MKIAAAQLEFSSHHSAAELYNVEEKLEVRSPKGELSAQLSATRVSLSEAGQARLDAEQKDASALPDPTTLLQNAPASASPAEGVDANKAIIDKDPKLSLLRMMIEMMTGRKVSDVTAEFGDPKNAAQSSATQGSAIYERHETRTELEQTDFSAEGTVMTADGREIGFSLQLSMSRSFSEETHMTARYGAALTDPLVLNFNGNAAALSNARFSFDLNVDGRADQMRPLAPGSGYLAFDKNNDGKVNDGSELFGAKSGNGFAELALLDDDGNGWIDENDSAWNSLRVWTKTASGEDRLYTLKEANVGAISVQNAETPFSLKNAFNNRLEGQIRASGIFLKESGGVGTVQQVDLVVG